MCRHINTAQTRTQARARCPAHKMHVSERYASMQWLHSIAFGQYIGYARVVFAFGHSVRTVFSIARLIWPTVESIRIQKRGSFWIRVWLPCNSAVETPCVSVVRMQTHAQVPPLQLLMWMNPGPMDSLPFVNVGCMPCTQYHCCRLHILTTHSNRTHAALIRRHRFGSFPFCLCACYAFYALARTAANIATNDNRNIHGSRHHKISHR